MIRRALHAGYMRWLEEIAPRMQVVKVGWTKFKSAADAWPKVEQLFRIRSRFTRSLVTYPSGPK